MKEKVCKKCGIKKELIDFRFEKSRNNYVSQCKDCEHKRDKKYREMHKEEIKKRMEEYRKTHKEEIRKYSKQYYENNNKKIKEHSKQNRKKYYEKNKDKEKEYSKQYRENNKNKINEYKKYYRKTHKEERNNYEKQRRERDEIYKLKCQCRNMIRDSFKRKNLKKNKKTESIIGIELDKFSDYLKQTFKNNYGYNWDLKECVHIDHIIPLATANTEEEVIKLCHYTNLQLLKGKDNLQKGCKTDYTII